MVKRVRETLFTHLPNDVALECLDVWTRSLGAMRILQKTTPCTVESSGSRRSWVNAALAFARS